MRGVFRRFMQWARRPFVTCDACWRRGAIVTMTPEGHRYWCTRHTPVSLSTRARERFTGGRP